LPAKAATAQGKRLRIADPFILVDGATWYAYGTGNVVFSSKDHGKTWESHHGMMKLEGFYRRWAPEVHKISGKYVAYMTLSTSKKGRSRIYVSHSDEPVHGWSHPRPITKARHGSDIDATFFHDPKTKRNYLLWKEDRKAGHGGKRIVMQPLDGKGLHTHGHQRTLLVAAHGKHSGFERRPHGGAPSVEAPTLEFHGGRYWLFYSAAGYEHGGRYAVGVASSAKATGPFKREAHPLITGHSGLREPGHQSVVEVVIGGQKKWLIFFHARGNHGNARYLHERQLVWIHGKPHVKR
jgi:arabinan endo-1,5-alpha-L-arabinosidase